MAYKTTSKIVSRTREIWEFDFRNVRKGTRDAGPEQTIAVAVLAYANGKHRTTAQRKKEAVNRFTQIVNVLYPNADQVVSSYGPRKMRVFV